MKLSMVLVADGILGTNDKESRQKCGLNGYSWKNGNILDLSTAEIG